MTDEQIRKFLKEFIDTSLNGLEGARIDNPLTPEQHKQELDTYTKIIHHLENRLGTINTRNSEVLLNELLREKNIQVDKSSPEYRKLRVEFTKAELEVNRIYRERLSGNYNNDYDRFLPSLVPQNNFSNKPAKLLSKVIDEYIQYKIANKEWKPKDLKEHTDFYGQFIQIIGDKDIFTYTAEDALRAFNILKKFPANWKKRRELRQKSLPELISLIERNMLTESAVISDTTLKKFIIWIRSIFDHAKAINYFSDFKIRKKQKASEERHPYSKDELQKWLYGPVYTIWNAEKVRQRPERFWVPLVVLLCGMRPNEVCQLYRKDIRQEESIWYFDINPKDDKSVKTLESERLVPIHPLLIELGFLRYCNSFEHDRIFPSITNYHEGEGYAELYNKWSARYNRL